MPFIIRLACTNRETCSMKYYSQLTYFLPCCIWCVTVLALNIDTEYALCSTQYSGSNASHPSIISEIRQCFTSRVGHEASQCIALYILMCHDCESSMLVFQTVFSRILSTRYVTEATLFSKLSTILRKKCPLSVSGSVYRRTIQWKRYCVFVSKK